MFELFKRKKKTKPEEQQQEKKEQEARMVSEWQTGWKSQRIEGFELPNCAYHKFHDAITINTQELEQAINKYVNDKLADIQDKLRQWIDYARGLESTNKDKDKRIRLLQEKLVAAELKKESIAQHEQKARMSLEAQQEIRDSLHTIKQELQTLREQKPDTDTDLNKLQQISKEGFDVIQKKLNEINNNIVQLQKQRTGELPKEEYEPEQEQEESEDQESEIESEQEEVPTLKQSRLEEEADKEEQSREIDY